MSWTKWIETFLKYSLRILISNYEYFLFRNNTTISLYNTLNFSEFIIEPPHDKTDNIVCAPIEDSDQPGHLISLFAVRSMGS